MVFLFVVLIIIVLIFFSKIQVEVENFKFISSMPKHLNKDYVITFKLCILEKIPIIKIRITDEKIKKMKLKEKLKKIDIKKIEKDISLRKIKEILEKTKFVIKKLKLNFEVGTENAAFTAFIISIMSIILTFFIRNKMKNYRDQSFNIKPLFLNKNLVNIEFLGIFEIKMIHIINIIYILNKKEGEGKNERTSNRRAYAYSYE